MKKVTKVDSDEPKTIVRGVLIRSGKILLGRQNNRKLWHFPGGNLMPGRSPEETLVTEFAEETALSVKSMRLILTMFVWQDDTLLEKNLFYQITGCKNFSKLKADGRELDLVDWFSARKMATADLTDTTRKVLTYEPMRSVIHA